MSFRNRYVDLRQDLSKPGCYRTLNEVSYVGGLGDVIRVPVGYFTDLASVPRCLWWLFPPNGLWSRCAIVHDWMCTAMVPSGEISRRDADGLFRRMLADVGAPVTVRYLMWAGVRAGSLWSDATPREAAELAAWSVFFIITVGIPTLVVLAWLVAAALLKRFLEA